MRVVCVEQDREVQDFIASAIAEKLSRARSGAGGGRAVEAPNASGAPSAVERRRD